MEPAVRFKKKAVEEHANSQPQSAAITAEQLSRVSTFNEEIEGRKRPEMMSTTTHSLRCTGSQRKKLRIRSSAACLNC